jgi:hypothetical protein
MDISCGLLTPKVRFNASVGSLIAAGKNHKLKVQSRVMMLLLFNGGWGVRMRRMALPMQDLQIQLHHPRPRQHITATPPQARTDVLSLANMSMICIITISHTNRFEKKTARRRPQGSICVLSLDSWLTDDMHAQLNGTL